MDFDLFEITIQRKQENFWPVVIEYSQKGYNTVSSRHEGKLELDRKKLLNTRLLEYGTILGQALFEGDKGQIGQAFNTACTVSSSHDKKLRIILFVEAEDLRDLRWEWLCISKDSNKTTWDFLVLQQQTPFSFYLPSDSTTSFKPIGKQDLRALVIVASPDELENYKLKPFNVKEAINGVTTSLGEIPYTLLATGTSKEPTLTEIKNQLSGKLSENSEKSNSKPYTLLHFVCHGKLVSSENIIYLTDENNKVKEVKGSEIIAEISRSGHERLPRFIFLCACDTAKQIHKKDASQVAEQDALQIAEQNALGGLAQQLVRKLGIPSVVGMTDTISVTLAQQLGKTFYLQLWQHGYVDQALVEASASLSQQSTQSFEVGVPSLFSRLRDHPLFSETLDEKRQLTDTELENGLKRFKERLPERAPTLEEDFDRMAQQLHATLRPEKEDLSNELKAQRRQALEDIEKLCLKVLNISFKALALNKSLPNYDNRCPFQGLDSFKLENREFFKGREQLIKKLEEKLAEHNFLPILGDSGSGKSSVVMAGLIPKLQENEPSLEIIYLTPDTKPSLSHFKNQLEEVQSQPDVSYLLVIDQFEELFTLCSDKDKRKEFIDELLALIENKQRVIITMRADFWGDCAIHKKLKELMQKRQELIAPMSKIELRKAIEAQAQKVQLRFEPYLLDQIFDDLDDEPGLMPLLQYAMLELWNRRHGQWLDCQEYRDIGEEGTGIRGAIAKTAENFLKNLFKEEQSPEKKTQLENQVKNIFLSLIRLDEDAAPGKERDTRKRVYLKDLLDSGNPVTIKNLVRRLAGEEARLVVTSRDLTKEGNEEDQETVEIAHEALIRYWKRLRTWLEENRADLLLRQTIGQEALEWKNHNKDKDEGEGYLALHGSRLNHAEDLLKRDKFLIGRQVDYVRACIERRDRLQKLEQERQAREKHLMRESLEKAISALAESARTLSILNRKLDALVKLIEAGKLLQKPPEIVDVELPEISPDVKFRFLVTFGQILDETAEFNSFEGHRDWVYGVSFSPDGKTVASASGDKTIKLWSFDGTLLQTLEGHEDEVIDVSFSPDGEMVASASRDKTIKLWRKTQSTDDKTLWTLDKTLEGHTNWVVGVSFSPDSQMIASASEDRIVRLWNQDGELLNTLHGHQAGVMNVAFSPNGKLIASASKDRTVKLWDLETYELTNTLEEHFNEVSAVSFSTDSKTLLSSSWDKTIMLWDINGNVESVISHDEKVYYATFSPDGETIVSASKDGFITLYNKNGSSKRTFKGHRDSVTKVSFSIDSKTFVSSSCDKSVKLWDYTGKFDGHSGEISKIDFSLDGKIIATASEDGSVKLWDRTGELQRTLEGHDGCVFDVKFSPNGKTIATTSKSEVKIWNLNKGKKIRNFSEHESLVRSISFNPEGTAIAIGYLDGKVILWNIDDDEYKILTEHTKQVNMVAFSPQGTMIATASSDKMVKLWDLNGDMHSYKEYKSSAYYASFSHNGKVIASANDNEIELWNPYTNYQQTLKINSNSFVMNISFFADSQMICSISSDQTIKFWRINDAKLLQNVEINGISTAAVSREGTAIAIANSDNRISLWSLNLEDLVSNTSNCIRDYIKRLSNEE